MKVSIQSRCDFLFEKHGQHIVLLQLLYANRINVFLYQHLFAFAFFFFWLAEFSLMHLKFDWMVLSKDTQTFKNQ